MATIERRAVERVSLRNGWRRAKQRCKTMGMIRRGGRDISIKDHAVGLGSDISFVRSRIMGKGQQVALHSGRGMLSMDIDTKIFIQVISTSPCSRSSAFSPADKYHLPQMHYLWFSLPILRPQLETAIPRSPILQSSRKLQPARWSFHIMLHRYALP